MARKRNQKMRELVARLRLSGMSVRGISRLLNKPVGTIQYFDKQNQLSTPPSLDKSRTPEYTKSVSS